jgi:hypothetical protein
MLGTRHVVAFSTLSLLLPALGWFYAVQDNTTPYWVLMALAFAAGLISPTGLSPGGFRPERSSPSPTGSSPSRQRRV